MVSFGIMKKIILKGQLNDGIIPNGQPCYFFVPFGKFPNKLLDLWMEYVELIVILLVSRFFLPARMKNHLFNCH